MSRFVFVFMFHPIHVLQGAQAEEQRETGVSLNLDFFFTEETHVLTVEISGQYLQINFFIHSIDPSSQIQL